jgi:hypothetical protein
MEQLLMIDRCKFCASPIYWDAEQSRRRYTCACLEKNSNCCSDGACEGMCFCNDDEEGDTGC